MIILNTLRFFLPFIFFPYISCWAMDFQNEGRDDVEKREVWQQMALFNQRELRDHMVEFKEISDEDFINEFEELGIKDPLEADALLVRSLQRGEDLTNPVLWEMQIEEFSLEYVLRAHQWLNEAVSLTSAPPSLTSDESVAYYGDAPPTTLYKQGKIAFLPAAPVVYTYDPTISYNYIAAAYSLPPTASIKSFFGGRNIVQFFLVLQRLIDDSTPQLLRLHGFIHGANAGSLNAVIEVAAELINHEEPIFFSNNTLWQVNSVHCHDGVASPSNFALTGLNDKIYTSEPFWQSVGVYLPTTQTATLIVFGHNMVDYELSELRNTPVLTLDFKGYLENLLGKSNSNLGFST